MQNTLINAIQNTDKEKIALILKQNKIDLNSPLKNGKSFLFYAPNLEILQLLIQKGNIDIIDNPVFNNRLCDDYTVLLPSSIISFGKSGLANPKILGYLMMHCCRNDKRASQQLEAFIKAGANVNVSSPKMGRTPLMCAYNYFQFRLLLEAGADIHKTDFANRSVSDYHTNFDIIRKIKACGGQITPERLGQLLINNKEENEKDRIKQGLWYLYNGANHDFGYKNEKGSVLFSYIDLPPVFQAMLHLGFDVNVRNYDGQTPLMLAPSANCVYMCVNAGANINAQDKRTGKTALHYAARENRLDIMGKLIRLGANINMRDFNGQTPLMQCTSLKSAMFLHSNGAEINDSDTFEKRSVLQNIAVSFIDLKEKYNLLKYLIQNGANLMHKDKNGKKIYEYPNMNTLAPSTRQVIKLALNTKNTRAQNNQSLNDIVQYREKIARLYE